jgi:hypothetical protein
MVWEYVNKAIYPSYIEYDAILLWLGMWTFTKTKSI